MSLTIQVKGLDSALAGVRAAVLMGVGNALEIAGNRAAALIQDKIRSPYLGRPPAVNTGILAGSITAERHDAVGLLSEVIFASAPADVYAAYVEAGTGPHFPPPRALLLWVRKKFGVEDEKKALSIAFAISRNIAKRGTSAFGMFARAFPILEGELQAIFDNAVAEAIVAAGLAP